MNISVKSNCIKCLKCIKICPSGLFKYNGDSVCLENIDRCIKCAHCLCVCPAEAISHSEISSENLSKLDYSKYPNSEQARELLLGRRSNRAFTRDAIPSEMIDMVIEAAKAAPTASNTRNISTTLIIEQNDIEDITKFTIDTYSKVVKTLSNPIVKPLIKSINKDLYKSIDRLKELKAIYENGKDPILRNAKAIILFHSPSKSRFGIHDCNLAYQNASLMAECLGIAHFYTGFVCAAITQNKQKTLNKKFGIEGHIHAGIAMGMPEFRYEKYLRRCVK